MKNRSSNLEKALRQFARATVKVKGYSGEHYPTLIHLRLGMRALKISPRIFLAYCAVVRTAKRNREFFSQPSFAAIFQIPSNWRLEDIQVATELLFKHNSEMRIYCHPLVKTRKGDWEIDNYLTSPKLVVLVQEGGTVASDFEVAAGLHTRVELGAPAEIRALARILKCGEMSDDDTAFVATQPGQKIDALFRPGQLARTAVAKLRKASPIASIPTTPSIDTGRGFGEASRWATQLKRDLADWRADQITWGDVDRGILLHGPPGTGKTRFAVALAHECGMELVATSIGKWQSSKDGHLGHMLKEMYGCFNDAKAKAPSLLFIDEVDSVGRRDRFSDRHASYSTQVVNALLEAVDGIDGREGVIVMGACNYPEMIDPALLRSGRLEKHIRFDLPDASGRKEILEFYLPELNGDTRLAAVASRLVNQSGADLERLARQARRTARTSNRKLAIEDLQNELPAPREVDDATLLRVAVHEAGHAILAYMLEVGEVSKVEVFYNQTSYATDIAAAGVTTLGPPPQALRTKSTILANIAMLLAGTAAEDVIFDDRSISAGGTRSSDLAKATVLAIEMAREYGLGNSLYHIPESFDPNDRASLWRDNTLRDEVNVILQKEFRRAKEILARKKAELFAFAVALKKEKKLEGAALRYFLTPRSPAAGKQGDLGSSKKLIPT